MVMERHAWKGRREQQPPAALIPDGLVFENSWWISEESSDLGNSLVARPRTVGVEFRRGPFIAGRGVGWLGEEEGREGEEEEEKEEEEAEEEEKEEEEEEEEEE
uniref:Uncharacterized protein n=1 Tax=Vespula pensylvanica TaxID=30213 RepID=A0A834PEG4_VESPE|nr:hypothetical protein H0235_000645 [Vespula pensylvanica]